MDDTSLSGIIGSLYDAALEPSQWGEALGRARDFIGGSAASIFSRDSLRVSFAVHQEDYRIDPDFKRLYAERYGRLDPMSAGQARSTVDQPLASTDIMDYQEVLASRIYQEWIRPQGFVDFINITVEKSPGSATLFGVFRHERDGMVDEGTRRRMRLIGAHVQRAAMIGTSFASKAGENATLTEMLDGLRTGLFLTGPAGQIVHANAAGRGLLASSGVLSAPRGKIVARDAAVHQLLTTALAATAIGDDALGRRAAALPLSAQERDPYVAHVMPLTSGERRQTGRFYGATAAVFVRKAEMDAGSMPETIARHYRLTPAELRVLLAVVDVGGVPDVAEALGISVTTTKTHLNRVYSKTGAGRQADLVKLVAGFASPLVS